MDPSYLGQPIPTPVANKPTGLMTKRTLLIVLGLGAALIAAAIMLFASGDKSGPLQQRVSVRQTTTLKIIEDGQKNISDDDLEKINSELKLVLLGDINNVSGALKAAGMKKVDKQITATEADAATFEKLKTAKLNAQYDTTYRTVLTQKIESLQALLQELHQATKSKQLKSALSEEYTHLGVYLKQLESLQ